MQLTALTALLALTAHPLAQEIGDDPRQVAFPDLGLEFRLPDLDGLEYSGRISDQLRGKWTGELGDNKIEIAVYTMPAREWRIDEPDAILESIELDLASGTEYRFNYDETDLFEGDYGYAPYAAYGQGTLRTPEGLAVGTLFVLGGLTEDFGYSIEVDCKPVAEKATVKQIRHFFEKSVEYSGDIWNHEWTDEEAEARWRSWVPEDIADKMREPVRTKHYIFLSNASGQDAFARKMEENYKIIRKTFPFPEVERRRLMPVFLFRTRDQYVEFTAKMWGASKEEAARSGGHASGDYYATSYESPNDPVHLHEQVHQIFQNRLRLRGGGSWYQEGVAEYVETRKNERSGAAREVKKGRHRSLRSFMQMGSLIYSTDGNDTKGGSEAGDLYKQAALFIEFMRESKFGKKKFPQWLHEMGRTPQDLRAIEAVFQRVYEVDLDRVEELFVEYCQKR